MSEGIDKALADVWRRSGPILQHRLAEIERGIDQLSGNRAEPSVPGGGRDQAHMLAGVLGTFGLDRGTVLARDLEQHLDRPEAAAEAPRLAVVAAELRAVVDGAAVA